MAPKSLVLRASIPKWWMLRFKLGLMFISFGSLILPTRLQFKFKAKGYSEVVDVQDTMMVEVVSDAMKEACQSTRH